MSTSCLPAPWGLPVRPRGRPVMTVAAEQRSSDDRHRADAALLRRIAAGDRAALGELYDRFSRPLYATALQILKNAAEAEDVIHDAFVAVWEKAAAFDPQRGSAFAWVVAFVRNRAIDRVRSRSSHEQLLAASSPADLGYDGAELQRDVGEQVAAREEAQAVRVAFAALPVDQQQALRLAFFGGLTQEEIARSLDQPLGTVKARIRRALHNLRDLLSPRP